MSCPRNESTASGGHVAAQAAGVASRKQSITKSSQSPVHFPSGCSRLGVNRSSHALVYKFGSNFDRTAAVSYFFCFLCRVAPIELVKTTGSRRGR